MQDTEESLKQDVQAIKNMSAVPNLLDVICKTTGMGFAVIARVTSERWIACDVKDNISFGMLSGDELELETTLCYEVQESRKEVVIENVAEDDFYRDHHTPRIYGFQSYISIPIYRRSGEFFGTLCAIDPSPNNLKREEIRRMFKLFAELISFQLETELKLVETKRKLVSERAASEEKQAALEKFNKELEIRVNKRTSELKDKNIQLEKMNEELQSFAYISSHDLQEPLRKIQIFSGMLVDRETNLSENGKYNILRMQKAASRMQSLIEDLLSYSRSAVNDNKFIQSDLNEIINDVRLDFEDEFDTQKAMLTVSQLPAMNIIPYQFRQLIYNLISNSIKFRHEERRLHIDISGRLVEIVSDEAGKPQTFYSICICDNGIGFHKDYQEKIFGLFQRLHERSVYEGTGIGLAIVRKIAENHKGFITAKPGEEGGAVFELNLPYS